MSTKTWQEKFEEEFWGKFGSTKTINEIKQFIVDIRKHDEEELIKKVDALYEFEEDDGYSCGYRCCQIESEQIIKDHYAK